MIRLSLLLATAWLLCHPLMGQQKGKTPSKTPASAEASFALDAGKQFEMLGQWEKAEEQYLKAGGESAQNAQKEPLDGVLRVRKKLVEEKQQSGIAAAKLLEEQERWKEAEAAYIDLRKSDPTSQKQVSEALAQLRPKWLGKRWSEVFDDCVAKVGRFLLLASALLIIGAIAITVRKARRSMQFLPFQASSDAASKQIVFWLAQVRAELRNPASGITLSPTLVSSLPFISMPGLPDQLTDSPELEFGGVKLPLKLLTQLIATPRVRVSGGWTASALSGAAFSEIERRSYTEFTMDTLVRRAIDPNNGAAQDRDLRLFAYDVVMKAGVAYGRK